VCVFQVALAKGHFDPTIPMLFGTNKDEGATFIYAAVTVPLPTVLVEGAILGIFGEADGEKVTSPPFPPSFVGFGHISLRCRSQLHATLFCVV